MRATTTAADTSRPPSTPVDPAGIPQELKDATRWVGSTIERRNGKLTKTPRIADAPERLASTTDAATWRSFETAWHAYEDGKFDFPGFVLPDGVTGIDLDQCRNPETGEITPSAMAIVNQFASYTEVSIRESGLHILVRGQLPGGRARRTNGIEVYPGGTGRYFVMIGNHLAGTPTTLEGRQDELNNLYIATFKKADPAPITGTACINNDTDQELIERATRVRNGDKFAALWSGDCSAYASQSEADQALCNMLAFWTGRDAARIDALFRQSGRMRGKWDERRGDQTYGQGTIDNAIAGCRETYEPRRQVLTSLDLTSRVTGKDGTDGGVELDDFYAFMPMHNYIFVPSREPWPGSSVNGRIPPIPVVDKNGAPVLDAKGNPKVIAATAWLDQHHPVEQMTWAPGSPPWPIWAVTE